MVWTNTPAKELSHTSFEMPTRSTTSVYYARSWSTRLASMHTARASTHSIVLGVEASMGRLDLLVLGLGHRIHDALCDTSKTTKTSRASFFVNLPSRPVPSRPAIIPRPSAIHQLPRPQRPPALEASVPPPPPPNLSSPPRCGPCCCCCCSCCWQRPPQAGRWGWPLPPGRPGRHPRWAVPPPIGRHTIRRGLAIRRSLRIRPSRPSSSTSRTSGEGPDSR